MAITPQDVRDLVACTMKDCPLPSVVDVLCATTPDDMDIMFNFIKEHYTEEQIKLGGAEFCDRVQTVNRFFKQHVVGESDGS